MRGHLGFTACQGTLGLHATVSTLQVAMSCRKYASAVMTVASTTLCGVALGASAAADAMAASLLQASARFTAVGRLHERQTMSLGTCLCLSCGSDHNMLTPWLRATHWGAH